MPVGRFEVFQLFATGQFRCSVHDWNNSEVLKFIPNTSGDDIYVAHVDIKSKIQRLKKQEEGHVPAPKTLSLYR